MTLKDHLFGMCRQKMHIILCETEEPSDSLYYTIN